MENRILIEEMAEPQVKGLVKIIDRKFAASFCAGRIRMGLVRSYRELYEEDPGARNDEDEHLGSIFQPDKVTLKIGEMPVEGITGPIKVRDDTDGYCYLLCLTAITDRVLNASGGNYFLDRELLSLGDAAVIITDGGEFIRRLEAAVLKHPHLRSHPNQMGRASRLVEYVNFDNHHGEVGPFRKAERFSFQHEWRLAVVDNRRTAEADHIFLDAGDLSDITAIMRCNDLLTNPFKLVPLATDAVSKDESI